jgi:hypothetical protein
LPQWVSLVRQRETHFFRGALKLKLKLKLKLNLKLADNGNLLY